MRQLDVPVAVDTAIRLHGQEAYPHECCGALIGSGNRVDAAVALPNTTEEGPRRRFMVRPSDYRMSEKRASEMGGELLGFYHSHPDHPARPSQYDLDHAWPNFAYIIVNVAGPGEVSDEAVGDAAAESRRGPEGAKADVTTGDMTVWFLKEDRSSFDEGSLNGK